MSKASETLAIARSYSEATNAGDWERLRRILAPNVRAKSHSADHVSHGPEEIIAALQATTGSVSDTRIEVVNAVAGEDQAVLELVISGMSRDDPPKRVWLPTCHVYRVAGGQIISITTYSDRRWREGEPSLGGNGHGE